MSIPPDIKEYINSNIRNKLFNWMLTTSLLVLFIILTESSFDVAAKEVKTLIYTAIIIAPVFIFKLPRLLFDRSWSGRIVRIFTDEEPYSTYKAFPSSTWASRTVIAYAEVLLDNGRQKTVVLHRGKYDSHTASRLSFFEVGNRIIHIRGTKYNKVISGFKTSCVVCGHINKINDCVCCECGYTLDVSDKSYG